MVLLVQIWFLNLNMPLIWKYIYSVAVSLFSELQDLYSLWRRTKLLSVPSVRPTSKWVNQIGMGSWMPNFMGIWIGETITWDRKFKPGLGKRDNLEGSFVLKILVLGCVLPLQEVALHQSFGLLCKIHVAPCCPTVSSQTMFCSSNWSYTLC